MNILLVNTDAANKYPDMFKTYLSKQGITCFKSSWREEEISNVIHANMLTGLNTIIHARAAGSNVAQTLKKFEDQGFTVINKSDTLRLTSNKYDSQIFAHENDVPTANTFKVMKDDYKRIKTITADYSKVIAKPIISEGRGVYCRNIFFNTPDSEIKTLVSDIPGDEIIIQEFIQYKQLVRAIVIGYKLLQEALTYDIDTSEYRASVCMNPNIKKFTIQRKDLTQLAEKTARAFKAEISFIDFFIDYEDRIILNELNTACSLLIHERVTEVKIHEHISDYLIEKLKKLKS
jgi:glutathione synthase/RimK-type ligase-like ATP-grasp enzyme